MKEASTRKSGPDVNASSSAEGKKMFCFSTEVAKLYIFKKHIIFAYDVSDMNTRPPLQ